MGVVLCQDRLFSKKHVEDTLAHELVHEWDHRRFNVDWTDLRMVACSEVSRIDWKGYTKFLGS
jgi:inner membrane protease ATP23